MKNNYSIKEVAKLFNISTNKIRFYEKKKLINPDRNEINDYRQYCEEDLIKLQHILMYRAIGLSIDDISNILINEDNKHYLDLFNKQWQMVNDEIHKLNDVRNSLEGIIDILYEDDSNVKDKMFNIIKETNELNRIKNQWKDKWNFNDWASTYDASVKEDKGALKIYSNYNEILDKVYELAIKNNDSLNILEIGVGTGNLAGRFLNNGHNIIGIDQSREMLVIAKRKHPSLKVRLGEFLKIPFENNMFDLIVSTYAFHHLVHDEKKVAIKEMDRVLNDRGRIIIGDLMFLDKNNKKEILSSMIKEQIDIINDEYYSDIEFLKIEFNKIGKDIKYKRMDLLNYIVEVF